MIDKVYSTFNKSKTGQLLAALIIGAILGLIGAASERLSPALGALCGSTLGLLAGLLLTSALLTFGTIILVSTSFTIYLATITEDKNAPIESIIAVAIFFKLIGLYFIMKSVKKTKHNN